MENSTISITINGVVENGSMWIEWFDDAKKIFNLFGYDANYIGINSKKYTSGKVMNLEKKEKSIVESIENGDIVQYISFMALPDDYKSASFDYDMMLVRDRDYVTLIINKSNYKEDYENEILRILNKYIKVERTEIYEMDRIEFPLMYAAKANSIEDFETIKMMKQF